ncbi:MAG: hypothetical protein P4L43_06835 [Syntrophobacteraceae bacterium]|nr:hypothetical protein [Syntrophobacteraceae bacterium]
MAARKIRVILANQAWTVMKSFSRDRPFYTKKDGIEVKGADTPGFGTPE